MSTPRCTRCGHGPCQQLALVLDGQLCTLCVVKLRKWLRPKRKYMTSADILELLQRLAAQHGLITARRLADALGKPRARAQAMLSYYERASYLERVGRGRYAVVSKEEAAE